MTQPAHSQDRIDEYGILPNPVQGIIRITDGGRVKPSVLVGSGRGKSGDGAIKTSPSVDLPAVSAPCRGLRANHGRGLVMVGAVDPLRPSATSPV